MCPNCNRPVQSWQYICPFCNKLLKGLTPPESLTERYWRKIKERQTGENKPDYDPWTGGFY